MKGTKFSRLLFQLQPKTLRTEEIDVGSLDFGMLPTITASFGERGGNLNPQSNHDTEKAMRIAIPKLIGLLPTPTAMMDEAPIEKVDARNQKQMEKGNSPFILGLGQQAIRGLLPTPSVSDTEGAPKRRDQISQGANGNWRRTSDNTGIRFGAKLNDIAPILAESTGKTSQLNPRFVAEMMGFPPKWTELPFQSGERNPSKDTETP
jgi:hypothetical protein